MASNYFLTENGRLIKIDTTEKTLFVLTSDAASLPLWQPIKCGINRGYWVVNEVLLTIIDTNFSELNYIFLDEIFGRYCFLLKNATQVYFLPFSTVEGGIPGLTLPKDLEDKTQLTSFLHDTSTIYQIAAYVSQTTSPMKLAGGSIDTIDYPFINQTQDAENKIKEVSHLKAFATKEIKRLDHWYRWNGRAKAAGIREALDSLESLQASNAGNKTIGFAQPLVAAAQESGLLKALSLHRHGFFNSGQAQSLQSLSEQCSGIQLKI